MEEKKEEKQVKKPVENKKEVKEIGEVTYIMNVTHLSWGYNKKSHFYAEKKPVISKKVMGKYHNELNVWLKNNWIKEGKY